VCTSLKVERSRPIWEQVRRKIQRAAAIASGADVGAVSRFKCGNFGLKTSHKPDKCLRGEGVTFAAFWAPDQRRGIGPDAGVVHQDVETACRV
jgi:hypothetical protein